jgi:hypothetical protein
MSNVIILYKENKIEKLEHKTFDEVLEEFKESRYYDEFYCEGMDLNYCLSLFLASNDGLNSTYDQEVYTELFKYVLEELKQEKVRNLDEVMKEMKEMNELLELEKIQ